MDTIETYLAALMSTFVAGRATEHSYRPPLQAMLATLLGREYAVTNEPKKQACGAPDLIVERGGVPAGYIEAKDIGVDLERAMRSDQLRRYLESLDNLILTDYLDFRLFRSGTEVMAVRLGNVSRGRIRLDPSAFEPFRALLAEFAEYRTLTIRSSKDLALMMAKKARLIKEVFARILASEDDDGGLHEQYEAFQEVLIHDISVDEFADIYAETLAYGLFTARLHDSTLGTFSRQEAYDLIPRSNPFLRQLFQYVATGLDDRATWIVDDLCDVFLATDVKAMLETFNRGSGRTDPFLHFYETFLGAYNPAKRKSRGVWYTPQPIVKFIVNAVDEVLRTQFKLPAGLADSSTTTIEVESQVPDKRTKTGLRRMTKEVHRVQILDVATGTGTFLAEVVDQIHSRFSAQRGLWSAYVDDHLVPRVQGFEILMASYAMCHMKLDLLLQETGYKPKAKSPRLHVYLTNSLEMPHEEVDRLPLVAWFSREANEASRIKKYNPIMVAIGNPPYSGISSNMGKDLIVDIDDYKYVDGEHFAEKKHWLHDDYVKFIRLGEHFVEKNGVGILAYITNHAYIDNPTFRGMRWHLLRTFDEIHILDLHGNAKKKETPPPGISDQNVFDIQQGVAVIVAVRTGSRRREKFGVVRYADLWGSREAKYDFLSNASLSSISWKDAKPKPPFFYFFPEKRVTGRAAYEQGFSVPEMFPANGVGIVTARDAFVMDFDKKELLHRMRDASQLPTEQARLKYNLRKDVQSWKVKWAQEDLKDTGPSARHIQEISYRPFDHRFVYYTQRSGGILARPNAKIMRNLLGIDGNVAMVVARQCAGDWRYAYITNRIGAFNLTGNAGRYGAGYYFPLYMQDPEVLGGETYPNLAPNLWKRLIGSAASASDPENVFNYVYGILHAPTYREAFAPLLRSDFPRIPFPASNTCFSDIANIGKGLRDVHLLQGLDLSMVQTSFPVDGSNEVANMKFEERGKGSGRVYINSQQYFDDVPNAIWDTYIGGYQPAQKWLKERKGRSLSYDDIVHWQLIVEALRATNRFMSEADTAFQRYFR